MPRVLFNRDFDFPVNPRVTIAYKANVEYLVSQECARQATEAGAGKFTRAQDGGGAAGAVTGTRTKTTSRRKASHAPGK